MKEHKEEKTGENNSGREGISMEILTKTKFSTDQPFVFFLDSDDSNTSHQGHPTIDNYRT